MGSYLLAERFQGVGERDNKVSEKVGVALMTKVAVFYTNPRINAIRSTVGEIESQAVGYSMYHPQSPQFGEECSARMTNTIFYCRCAQQRDYTEDILGIRLKRDFDPPTQRRVRRCRTGCGPISPS